MNDLFDHVEDKHAINIIKEFFWVHGLDYAIMDMEHIIYYAAHRKHYKRKSPYTLVFFAEELRKLVTASLQLAKNCFLRDAFEVAPAEHGLPDLGRKEDFMPDKPLPDWYYLPRHLSVAQYLNPAKTFRQFQKYQSSEEWMKTIDELLEYALSQATISECYPSYNILKIRRLLLQLIEGAYLVLIRYRRSMEAGDEIKAAAETSNQNIAE